MALPAKNVFFSLMTFMLISSQRDVRRPVQIMLMTLGVETITLGVNWWATHSGGPMHGEIFGPPVAPATQVLQVSDAVSSIVLASKSCIRHVRGGVI